jgi:circadian clock protein KaiB
MTAPQDATLKRFEDELAAPDGAFYGLTLFISGASVLSARAIADATRLCDLYLGGCHELSVVDVYEDPTAVLRDGVLATPTLVRNRPLPMRKVVGDLSEAGRVLSALGIPPAKDAPRGLR